MANHTKLKGLIESLLIIDEDCRDDVPYLYIQVVKEIGEHYDSTYSMLTKVNYNSVCRLKNHIQKHNIELRGENYESRKQKQEKVKKQYSHTYWDRLKSWWDK